MNHLLFASGKTRYLPSNLAECDLRQYVEMSALALRYFSGQISYDDFKFHGFYALLNMIRKESPTDEANKMANVYQYSQLLDSFFNETKVDGKVQKVLKMDYNHNPIPSVPGVLRKYYGPADEFNNVKWREYRDGLSHFIDFNDTGDIMFLYRLIAVFYRKATLFPKSKSDKREKYDPDTVERRARMFKKHHIGVAYGFYLFFAAMQKYVSTAVIYVQGKEIDLSVLFDDTTLIKSKQKESDLPGLGFIGLEYTLAESGVFGTIEGVGETGFWDVILKLYDIVKKDQDFQVNQK